MAVLQNPIHLLSQIRKKFPEAEKEDWILRLDDTKRKPSSDSICGLNATDVIGRRIDQLCVRDDKSVLDTLLDSVAECSAELRLCIKENIISTRARTLKSANNNSDGSIVLECAVIRCLKHCLQKQFSAPGGCSSDNNGTNNNAKLKMSSSSESLKSCAIEDTALDKRRHSTPSETLSPETPFDVPRCGIDAISPATATESSASVHFETLSPPSSIPTEL
ncbi:unnamed protein product, partial [Anisakis simplex]|uniref:Uncharacterized protein n=1 Tax=Anisakis simplex TaxID=6269 RepID=A0A0M3K2N5_ANISI